MTNCMDFDLKVEIMKASKKNVCLQDSKADLTSHGTVFE